MSEKSLRELEQNIKKCSRCALAMRRANAVPGEGSLASKILFIGEAPGRQEDLQGKPFVGSAGKFLNILLQEAGLSRENVYITNIVKCRPPGNRNPTRTEIDACIPYLKKQISMINPKIIILLGNVAIQTLLDKKLTATKCHGRIYKRANKIYFPTCHPAAALYLNKLKKVMHGDFKKIKALL